MGGNSCTQRKNLLTEQPKSSLVKRKSFQSQHFRFKTRAMRRAVFSIQEAQDCCSGASLTCWVKSKKNVALSQFPLEIESHSPFYPHPKLSAIGFLILICTSAWENGGVAWEHAKPIECTSLTAGANVLALLLRRMSMTVRARQHHQCISVVFGLSF